MITAIFGITMGIMGLALGAAMRVKQPARGTSSIGDGDFTFADEFSHT